MNTCPYCGAEVKAGANFCRNCGSSTSLPQSEIAARVILYEESGKVLQEYPLEKLKVSIGCSSSSDIVLTKDKLASLHHATISSEHGRYLLRDEYSANGTFVNGQQIEEATPYLLHDGDQIGIGEHELVFHQSKLPGDPSAQSSSLRS
jgi:pSer/pThr/pTyr-binding forkhead associated (FHA) protein